MGRRSELLKREAGPSSVKSSVRLLTSNPAHPSRFSLGGSTDLNYLSEALYRASLELLPQALRSRDRHRVGEPQLWQHTQEPKQAAYIRIPTMVLVDTFVQ